MQVTPFSDQGYYTEMHNALLDVVLPALRPSAWAILCVIIRQTKGWRRDVCPLRVADIMKLAGVGSQHTVVDGLKELRSFKQGGRNVPLLVEYDGEDQRAPKSYGLNRMARIEWEPGPSPCVAENAMQKVQCRKRIAKTATPIRKEENHVGEKRGGEEKGNKNALPSFGPNDDFQIPLPDETLKAEISKICGCPPVNGGALKLERAAISISTVGGTVALLREYVEAESKKVFKVEFIASDFGGWLARRQRNGASNASSPTPPRPPVVTAPQGWKQTKRKEPPHETS